MRKPVNSKYNSKENWFLNFESHHFTKDLSSVVAKESRLPQKKVKKVLTLEQGVERLGSHTAAGIAWGF